MKSAQIQIFFWSLFSCIRTEYRKIRTRKNSVFGHFSRSYIVTNRVAVNPKHYLTHWALLALLQSGTQVFFWISQVSHQSLVNCGVTPVKFKKILYLPLLNWHVLMNFCTYIGTLYSSVSNTYRGVARIYVWWYIQQILECRIDQHAYIRECIYQV